MDEVQEAVGRQFGTGIHSPLKPQPNFWACCSLQWLIQSSHRVWHPVGASVVGAVVRAAGRQGITG